jgi:hypothetical protein
MKYYHANSDKEAWSLAGWIFPTEYVQDPEATKDAGYPVYRSTDPANDSWISALGTRLELNLIYDTGRETVEILIDELPEIAEIVSWTVDDVRALCVRMNWYDAGTFQEYRNMLMRVERVMPTPGNIYLVARDILEHTSDKFQYVENVMYELNRNAVRRSYEVRS